MTELPWLKLYTEALHDPKFIVAATDNQMDEMTVFGIWSAILCLAARSPVRGYLVASNNRNFTIEQLDAIIGWHGNMGTGDLSSLMNSFIDLDMIAIDEHGAYYIVNFETRQETKDEKEKRLNRERQKRFQESHKEEDSVINNVINNAPLTDSSSSSSISISNSLISSSDSLTETPNIFKSYENTIGMITPTMRDKLLGAEKDYPPQWIERAFEICIEQNKRNWAYASAILERWKTDGYDGDKKHGKKQPARRDTPEGRAGYEEY